MRQRLAIARALLHAQECFCWMNPPQDSIAKDWPGLAPIWRA